MRLWLRVVVTLVLSPLLWQAGAIHLGAAQGGDPKLMAETSMRPLPRLYLTYTLPALAVVVLLLVPIDSLLALFGADLLIVAVAPLVAAMVPPLLSIVVHAPRLDVAGIGTLACVYGLVFGLTIREPRRRTASSAPLKERPA